MASEVIASLVMDRSLPIGNSPGSDNRGRLHVKVDEITGNLEGQFSPTGLKVAIKTTTADITDTATTLPLVSLIGRNSMVIHNKSVSEILYIGNYDVTADSVLGTTSGHEVLPGETFAIDITDQIVLYGIAPTGKTIRVKITEVA